ncbi:LacI family DNA-binding transcriptional regulator [Saccharothrix saharensis]|uniref:LacI family DNA-binding transcriptional regulator n=1 Tax=Saccharothrix saharensis TaxID=571190 RepID=UPI0036824541
MEGSDVVTLAQVARHAGVATSTASYVLSGKRSISAATRRRVEESVRQLGYAPRSLPNVKLVALVLPDRADGGPGWLGAFLSAATALARQAGADLVICPSAESVRLRNPDAVIVVAPTTPPLDVTVPVVRVGGPADRSGHGAVDVDRAEAGVRCAEYLADLGHRTIAVVHGGSDAFLHSVRAVAERRGTTVRCHAWPVTPDDLFAGPAPVTAVVAADGHLVAPVLAHLGRRHLRVPWDISVVALCADETAEAQGPGVTSIGTSAAELGRAAMDLALAETPGTKALPPRLTVRSSTGPAWSGADVPVA